MTPEISIEECAALRETCTLRQVEQKKTQRWLIGLVVTVVLVVSGSVVASRIAAASEHATSTARIDSCEEMDETITADLDRMDKKMDRLERAQGEMAGDVKVLLERTKKDGGY